MFFQLNIFGIVLILSSILALFVMYYSIKHNDNRIYFYLALFSLFFFFDAFFQGLDCLTTPFMFKALCGQLSSLGYIFVAPGWLLLVYCLTHNQKDLPHKYSVPVLTVSGIFLLIALSDPWTHLLFSHISLPTGVPYKLQLYYSGTWIYTLVWVYGFLLGLISIFMLLKSLITGSKSYRNSYLIALVSSIIAISLSGLALTSIYPGFSYTVSSYLVVFIFLTIAVFVYDGFDISKLVNESVISEIDVGILYFNDRDILSDMNPVCESFGFSNENLQSSVNNIFRNEENLLDYYFDDNLKVYTYNFGDSWLEAKKTIVTVDNEFLGKVFTVTDVTNRVNELNQKDMLVKEVNHRVKNNLQIILSLLNLDLRFHPNNPMSVLGDTRSRLNYMSMLHEKLYSTGDTTEVDLESYLYDISNGLFNMYNSNIELKIDVDDVKIDLDLAVSLGLILTEIINNTIKYGFPNEEYGNFSIKFIKQDKIGVLDLYDDGVGLPDGFDFESSNGLGMTVIKSLTTQINGECFIVPDEGAHFRIKFPLN